MLKKMFRIIDKLLSLYWKLRFRRLFFGSFGENNIVRDGFKFLKTENINFGSNIYIGPKCFISAFNKVTIGSGTIFGPQVRIYSANHDYKLAECIPYGFGIKGKEVIIEENCWIGGDVIITSGTVIGEGSVVGAGAVVRGRIPKFSIAIGNPIQIVGQRDIIHYNRLKKEGKIYMKIKNAQK